MVLVPPYVEVDGLVLPLRVHPVDARGPAAIGTRFDDQRPQLQPLIYVLGDLLSQDASATLERVRRKEKLPLTHGLVASPVTASFDDFADSALNWERLAGYAPDLSDVYFIATTFLREDLVIPRMTFIRLMEKLYELDAALREGRLEPQIDESIPIPPPRPEPPKPPPRFEDDELRDMEARLIALDAMDPLVYELAESTLAARAGWQRGSLFSLMDVAWRWTRDGVDDVSARYRELGLTMLMAYDDAIDALLAYLHDPERIAITKTPPPDSPFGADVSVDLFRLPVPAHLPEYSRHVWLAYAEAAFVRARRAPTCTSAGDLFTRIGRQMVRMRFRSEVGSHFYLWRVQLEPDR